MRKTIISIGFIIFFGTATAVAGEDTAKQIRHLLEKEQNGEKVIGLNTENSELNEGIAETIVKMYRKGYEAEQISDILDMEVEEVRKIIENE